MNSNQRQKLLPHQKVLEGAKHGLVIRGTVSVGHRPAEDERWFLTKLILVCGFGEGFSEVAVVRHEVLEPFRRFSHTDTKRWPLLTALPIEVLPAMPGREARMEEILHEWREKDGLVQAYQPDKPILIYRRVAGDNAALPWILGHENAYVMQRLAALHMLLARDYETALRRKNRLAQGDNSLYRTLTERLAGVIEQANEKAAERGSLI